MNKTLLVLAIFYLSTALLAQQPLVSAAAASKPVYITHVTVIDTETGAEAQDQTVVIAGGRIAEVKDSRNLKTPAGAKVIEGKGKYLIPGLWDMHVHVFSGQRFPIMLPLLIANGVTGVRDMGTYVPLANVNRIRKEIAHGKLLGPRILAAGPAVDGQFKDTTNLNVTSASEARGAVRSLKQQGADFIKVYDNLSRAAYFAIAGESRKQGIPFAGHVPYAVTAREASAAGQKSIEHFTGILPACSREEEKIQLQYDEALKEPDFSLANVKGVRADIRAADTFSTKRCTELAAFFRAHRTWQCPTLVELRATYAYDASSMTNDWRLKYIPKKWKSDWAPENDIFMKDFTAEDQEGRVRLFRRLVELVGTLHRGGVDFLAGTDLGRPYIFAGFSLHDELGLEVESGVSPLAALQSATRNPALFMGATDKYGSVTPGKIADLVLLDADPIADIHNTTKIAEVFLAGKEFDRAALDQMLRNAEATAKATTIK